MQTLQLYGLSERDEQAILGIFQKYPEIDNVLIFGSRAKGVFHKGSDIDLAIVGEQISCNILQQIKDDFEESSLPYRVDLVDMEKIDYPPLKEHINRVGKQFYRQTMPAFAH